MAELQAHGIAVSLPAGWDGRIVVRGDGAPEPLRHAGGVPVAVATAHPVVHLASFGLPEERGDFGGGAVELMGERDVFVVLFEYATGATRTALFARRGLPRMVAIADFDPTRLRRGIIGQSGTQVFFQEEGRAFCLYVVLGSHAARRRLVPVVNAVLATVRIDPQR